MVPHVPMVQRYNHQFNFDIGECGTRCDPSWSKVLFVSIMNTAFILHGDQTPLPQMWSLSSLSGVNHLEVTYHRFAWQTQNEAEPPRRLQIHWKTSELWKRSQSWHDDMVSHQKMLVLVRCWSATNPHLTCPCSKHATYTAVPYTDKPNHQTHAFQEQNEKGIRPVNNKIAHLQEISYRTHWVDP